MATTAVTLKASSPKQLHSHFSIENILRKEEKITRDSSKQSTSSYSDISLHEEEQYTPLPPEMTVAWKRGYIDEYHRRETEYETTRPTTLQKHLPVLESRHRLTEHWVYENHYQRPRNLPVLRSNHYHHTKRMNSYPPSVAPEFELIPSPSLTPPTSDHIKRQTLEYWFLDRMMRNYGNGANGAGYPTVASRRTHPEAAINPMKYYWNAGIPDDRDGFPGLLPRSARMKTSMNNIDDNDSDDGNRKGGQVRFSHTQSTELERVFSLQKYVSPQERKQLARSIDLSERQVKTWFQNRRAKWRRIKLEDEMRNRMGENGGKTSMQARNDSTSSSKMDDGENITSSSLSETTEFHATAEIDFRQSHSEFRPSESEFHQQSKTDYRPTKPDFRLDFRVRDENRVC